WDLHTKKGQMTKDEFEKESAAITARWENAVKEREEIVVKPKKTGIEVTSFFLAWVPHWQITTRDATGTTRTDRVDASTGQ
ncbi:MAG TPA: hypothetical protein PLV88_02370, partial [Methanoregulaceae archaeon]|nr:hypothetical protein [Methanoregulaceae archaeon]